MGHLKGKYTEEYYTGKSKDGTKLNYGATSSLNDKGEYVLREHDKRILEKVDFNGKAVLALGCGRGEELSFAIDKGAIPNDTVGVDFSRAAIKICKQIFSGKGRTKSPKLFVEDALEFVYRYHKLIEAKESKKFDIVIMFDFVEHVPRKELAEILIELKKIINNNAIILINTPAYRFDNDVLGNGYDERNKVGLLDMSDDIPETEGMHCNKYSLISLQQFMEEQGYTNATEAHFFVNSELNSKDFSRVSYLDRWNQLKKENVPIYGDYFDDVIEIPYKNIPDIKLITFIEGNLRGLSIFTTEENKRIAFPDENTDPEMMQSIIKSEPLGKTIFDVGTFIGTSAMLFAKMVGNNGTVIGFEPNLFNRNRTFLNLSHNFEIPTKIFVYEFALGSDNKKQNMLLSPHIDIGHSSTSRLKGSHATIQDDDLPAGFEEVEVEVKTLDVFVQEENIYPDIIKVDIEGAEYDFLLGSIDTIRSKHPLFYIELHSQYCAVKCSELLIFEGYSIEILNEEEDNRVIIRAEYSGKIQNRSINETNLLLMRDLTNTFSSAKAMLDVLISSNKDYQKTIKETVSQYDSKITHLQDEINGLKNENEYLSNEVNEIYKSKKYKIINKVAKIKNRISR